MCHALREQVHSHVSCCLVYCYFKFLDQLNMPSQDAVGKHKAIPGEVITKAFKANLLPWVFTTLTFWSREAQLKCLFFSWEIDVAICFYDKNQSFCLEH